MKNIIKISVICILQLVVTPKAMADYYDSTTIAGKQYHKAHSLYLAADYESAFVAFEKAAALYKINPNWVLQADVYSYLSGLSWFCGKLENGTAYCDTSMIILTGNNAGPLHQQLAKAYHNYGTIELLKGNLMASVAYYEKAIAINEQATYPMETSLVSNYQNIGVAYTYMKRSDMSLVYANKCLDLSLKYEADNYYSIGQSYHNLGVAYGENYEYREAEKNYKKALEYYKRVLTEPHITLGQLYLSIGSIKFHDSSYMESIEYNDMALYNFRSKDNTLHPESFKLFHNNAKTYEMMGEYDQAIGFEQKSIDYWENQGYLKLPFLANSYEYMGRIYSSKQQYDNALVYFQKALIANIYDFNDTSIAAMPELEEILDKFYLSVAFIWKADALTNKYYETKDPAFLYMAADNYYLFSEVVALSLQELVGEDAVLTLYRNYIPSYENAISFCHVAYKYTNDNTFLEDAFYFSEKTNALVLNVALNNEDAVTFAGIPEEFVQKDQMLNETLLRFEDDYNNLVTTLPLDTVLASAYLNDSIFDTKIEIKEMNTFLEDTYPQYFQLKNRDNVIPAKEVQSTKLTANDAIIEYYLGDTTLYVFTLTKNEIALDAVNINSIFLNAVDDFRESTSSHQFIQSSPIKAKEMFVNSGFDLYNKLFPKKCKTLIKNRSNLIIIPDGILNYVPFDALVTKRPNTDESYSDIDYLIKDFTIAYAYSASMLNNNRNKAVADAYYAGYAPVYDTSLLARATELEAFELFRSAPSALTGNISEVQNAGKLLDGDIYIGPDAGEKNFKEKTRDYSILHLAMHALINDKNPLSSTLIFTNTNDSVEDDYLHTYEIYGLKLNADLAVLSACNTADGLMQSGEGIMSLGRAFMYAGVDNMVSTLWTANDATSKLLMEGFFGEIQKGTPIADALRNSKVSYLKTVDPTHANPYYWANFVLIGNNEVVYAKPMWKTYWIWMLGGLLLILVFVWRKRIFLLHKINS